MTKMPNKFIKSVRSAHPTAQELRTSYAAAYEWRWARTMKVLLLWLSIASVACAADTDYLHAADVLKSDGVLLIFDGSSYYAFKADGSFSSFPRGMSGRSFEGTWKKTDENPLKLEVTAKKGWVNGIQPRDDYRKIVFFVYDGGKRAVEKSDFGAYGYREIFDGYFVIDEMTRISKLEK